MRTHLHWYKHTPNRQPFSVHVCVVVKTIVVVDLLSLTEIVTYLVLTLRL